LHFLPTSAFFIFRIYDGIRDLLSSVDNLLKVLSQEHEHVMGSLHLLGHVNQEKNVFFEKLSSRVDDAEWNLVAFAIKLVQRGIIIAAFIDFLNAHDVVFNQAQEFFLIFRIKRILKSFNGIFLFLLDAETLKVCLRHFKL
jgi:hypothetical protein